MHIGPLASHAHRPTQLGWLSFAQASGRGRQTEPLTLVSIHMQSPAQAGASLEPQVRGTAGASTQLPPPPFQMQPPMHSASTAISVHCVYLSLHTGVPVVSHSQLPLQSPLGNLGMSAQLIAQSAFAVSSVSTCADE